MKALLLLFNAGKLGKLLMMSGTMLVSIVTYAFVYGWRYAVGFVGLILIHEMGHYIAARQRGLDVGLPTFIPFIGAWIELKDKPHHVETEAYIGLAGPLAGGAASLVCYYISKYFHSELILALSYSGFFLNLFNLIPLHPFDGGRITAVLSPRIWMIGAPMLVGFFIYSPSPLLIIMAVLAWPQLVKAWRFDPESPENQHYYRVDAETRFTYAICYLGLIVFLALMSHNIFQRLGSY